MSAPDPRIPDNAPKLSWFAKKGNGKSPEAQAVDDAIEQLRDVSDYDAGPAMECYVNVPIPPREIDLLEELAVILRRLTWAQMTEFGTGINADPKNVHDWSAR